MSDVALALEVEPLNAADTGRCPCCGHVSRKAWGLVRRDGKPHATYFVHWTVGHVFDQGAHIDLIRGQWDEGTTTADRCAVSRASHPRRRAGRDGVDADMRDIARNHVVGVALKRADVIGSPIANAAFAIYDAIVEHDPDLAALWEEPSGN